MTNLTLIHFVPFGRSDTETEIGLSCKNRPFVLPLLKTGQLDVVKHAAVCDLENFAASSRNWVPFAFQELAPSQTEKYCFVCVTLVL